MNEKSPLALFCAGRRQTPDTRRRLDGAYTGFKDLDIHEIERSCPTSELSSIYITLQVLASTNSEGTLADGEKAFMQGDPSVRDEPLYATPPPEGLPGAPVEGTDQTGPRGVRAGKWHVRVPITNCLTIER